MMLYVEILTDRCSSSAPLRAASEWIRACVGQPRVKEKDGKAHTLDNDAAQAVCHEDYGPSCCLPKLALIIKVLIHSSNVHL